jgi:hypothetical protein
MNDHGTLRVIGGLTHIDMIIRVDWSLGAEFTAQDFNGSVGEDLLFNHFN